MLKRKQCMRRQKKYTMRRRTKKIYNTSNHLQSQTFAMRPTKRIINIESKMPHSKHRWEREKNANNHKITNNLSISPEHVPFLFADKILYTLFSSSLQYILFRAQKRKAMSSRFKCNDCIYGCIRDTISLVC